MELPEGNYVPPTILKGLIEFFRSGCQHNTLLPTLFQNQPERVIYSTGIHLANCNGVIEKNPNSSLEENQIDAIMEFFKAKGLPFVWWLPPNKALENKGFQFGESMKGLTLNISHRVPKVPDGPANLTIKVVEKEEELHAFTQTLLEAFGIVNNSSLFEEFQTMNAATMKSGEQIHLLGYIDEVPVATATLEMTPLSASIWNCATLPAYRGKGIGTILTFEAIVEAWLKKYPEVITILMPNGLAGGVFNRLGFKEVCDLPFYVYDDSSTNQNSQ